jgi:hypothetical protein
MKLSFYFHTSRTSLHTSQLGNFDLALSKSHGSNSGIKNKILKNDFSFYLLARIVFNRYFTLCE